MSYSLCMHCSHSGRQLLSAGFSPVCSGKALTVSSLKERLLQEQNAIEEEAAAAEGSAYPLEKYLQWITLLKQFQAAVGSLLLLELNLSQQEGAVCLILPVEIFIPIPAAKRRAGFPPSNSPIKVLPKEVDITTSDSQNWPQIKQRSGWKWPRFSVWSRLVKLLFLSVYYIDIYMCLLIFPYANISLHLSAHRLRKKGPGRCSCDKKKAYKCPALESSIA